MKKLPLTVSSKLTNLEVAGAAMQLTAYANATQTAEKAPVLVAVQSDSHVDADKFASLLLDEGGQGTQAQARLMVNSLASVFAALVEKYGAITVNTPFGTVQTFIAGTVENAQDQPDPETNYPFLAVVVPEVYRKLFSQFETYVPSEACPVTLRRVRDKATNRSGICGTEPFYLEGSGMTFGGAGEKLELLDEKTGELVTTATADTESASKVQLVCSLASGAAVPVGRYKLRLTTLAGGDTTLWPVDLKVEILEAVTPPVPEPLVTSQDGLVKVMSLGELTNKRTAALAGVNVGYDAATGRGIDKVVAYVGGKEVHWKSSKGAGFDAGEVTLTYEPGEDAPAPGEYTADVAVEYALGTGEGYEELVIQNRTIVIGE